MYMRIYGIYTSNYKIRNKHSFTHYEPTMNFASNVLHHKVRIIHILRGLAIHINPRMTKWTECKHAAHSLVQCYYSVEQSYSSTLFPSRYLGLASLQFD